MIRLTETNGRPIWMAASAIVCVRSPDDKARERKANSVVVAQLIGRVLVTESEEEVAKLWQEELRR